MLSGSRCIDITLDDPASVKNNFPFKAYYYSLNIEITSLANTSFEQWTCAITFLKFI